MSRKTDREHLIAQLTRAVPALSPYCRPLNAGLASEPGAVARRIGKLIATLDREINGYLVEGQILDDIRSFRLCLCDRLEADGWTYTYSGTDRLLVRPPGHARPFPKHDGTEVPV